MSSLMLDSNNNLVTNNSFLEVSGDTQLLQDCKNLISLWLKENPFNINEGIDYLGFLQDNNLKAIVDKIATLINSDDRVNNCLIELVRDDVNVKLNVNIVSKEGNTYGFIV